MRIVSIVPRLFPIPGGPEKLIFNLSRMFAQFGHDVHVLAFEGAESNFYNKYDFTVHYIPMPKTGHFKYILKHLAFPFVLSKLIKIKPDIVHAHDTPFILPAIFYKKVFNRNCKVILSTHYFFKENPPLVNKLLFSFDMKAAPILASPGKAMQSDTKRLYGKDSYVVDLGIETNKFKKSPASMIKKLKEKYKIPDDKKIILFLGRIVDQKGIELAVDAVSEVVKKDSKVLYVLAGGGDEEYIKNLWRRIEHLGIKNNVMMIGKVPEDDIIGVYSMADIFLTTTLWETISISAMEALSCSTPVIATDVGSMRDVVIDGFNGFIIKKRDQKAVAEKVLLLLKNKQKFSKNARQFMEDNYELKKVSERYIKFYDTLLKEGKLIERVDRK